MFERPRFSWGKRKYRLISDPIGSAFFLLSHGLSAGFYRIPVIVRSHQRPKYVIVLDMAKMV